MEPTFRVKGRPNAEEAFQYFSPRAPFQFYRELVDEASGSHFLVLIDSINERQYDWPHVIQELAGALGRPNVAIVIADRMTDRRIGGDVALATALPLSWGFLNQYLSDSPSLRSRIDLSADARWVQLLEMPLFLALAEKLFAEGSEDLAPTRISMLQDYFEKTAGISKAEMTDLGDIGLRFYSLARATQIDEAQLTALFAAHPTWEPVYKKLLSSGALVRSDTKSTGGDQTSTIRARFRHQTFHDFAIGQRLSWISEGEDETFWRNQTFDIATLNAASFEALDYAVEALTARGDPNLTADRFLTEVYDWNYGAVLQGIRGSEATLGQAAVHGVSRQFRAAIFAVSAEKLFDHFRHTKEATQKAFRDVAREGDLSFLNAPSVRDLVDRVSHVDCFTQSRYWSDWQQLFCRTDAAGPVSPHDLSLLWNDPVVSWTAANVFRRVPVSPEAQAQLLEYYSLSRSTSEQAPRAGGFRWRVVHMLGRAPTAETITFLLKCAVDPCEYHWARYGAIRSYVEAISLIKERKTRQEYLFGLASQLDRVFLRVGDNPSRMSRDQLDLWFSETAQLRRQVSRCRDLNLELHSLPDGWFEDYGVVLQRGAEFLKQLGYEGEAAEWLARSKEQPDQAERAES
jgi:hypothetical protein